MKKMSDLLTKKLTAADFNPEIYVQQLARDSVGGLELQQQRQKIQQLAEDTNSQLKKNVYMNYMQFIETAKEISYLESEMYQLSHLITEQKCLLTSLSEIAISGEKPLGHLMQEKLEVDPQEIRKKKQKENRKKLAVLLEKVEKCSHIMEVEDRYLLFDGDLVELNLDDYSGTQRVHAYLLNDSFMTATWLSDRRGPVRYHFEELYTLDQVLPVNIKDRGAAKNAFKVLIFPGARVFQAPSAKAKQDWLDELERAKHNKMIADKEKAEEAQQMQQQKDRQASLSKEDSVSSTNPFAEDDDSYNPFLPETPVYLGPPEWVIELPEELDQAVAQRNFEDAVALIDKGREYFDSVGKKPENAEMRRALEGRVRNLIEVLQAELHVTPEKTLQGGPRAARRATTLLVHLNRSAQACELFLKQRTAILKSDLKRLRLEGKTILFVKQLCSVFFRNLMETAKEFKKAFPTSKGCASAFVVWTHKEISNFASLFSRHVFTVQSSLNVVSKCISCADHHSQQMASLGLSLTFSLHMLLLRDVEKWIQDGREKMLEAVKLRVQEDTWKGLKFETEQQLNIFIDEMNNNTGISSLEGYKIDDVSINLTKNTVHFVNAYLGYLEDVLRLRWSETENLINDSLASIFAAQLRHCRTSIDDPVLEKEVTTIQRNSAFLIDVILPLVENRYFEVTGCSLGTLAPFYAERPHLTGEGAGGPTTVSKYESNFLLIDLCTQV